jgi:hypothetical protein
MEPYIDEFGNLQFKQPANYTGINGINMNQLNIEPYNSMAEMRGQPESRSVLDQGLPFALPNLNYRNYDLSNLFNTTEPDLNNSALARRLMTQPGLDKFTGINKGVYDPYGIKVEDGRFSYDMNKTSLADYQKPKNRFTGMDTSYGVANEPDVEQVDYLPGQKKSFRDSENLQEYFQNRNPLTGIMNLFRNLPTPMNILRGGLQGIQSLNQRLRNTDFGQSKTLADYFDARRYGGRDARDAAAARNMAQARGLQKEMAQRPSAIGGGEGGGGRDMGAAATRSKDLGSMRGGVGR